MPIACFQSHKIIHVHLGCFSCFFLDSKKKIFFFPFFFLLLWMNKEIFFWNEIHFRRINKHASILCVCAEKFLFEEFFFSDNLWGFYLVWMSIWLVKLVRWEFMEIILGFWLLLYVVLYMMANRLWQQKSVFTCILSADAVRSWFYSIYNWV